MDCIARRFIYSDACTCAINVRSITMRSLLFLTAGILLASSRLFSADLSPDEKKLQAEFGKAYRVNDKDARKTALSMMESTKHPSSWQQVAEIVRTDPDSEV